MHVMEHKLKILRDNYIFFNVHEKIKDQDNGVLISLTYRQIVCLCIFVYFWFLLLFNCTKKGFLM